MNIIYDGTSDFRGLAADDLKKAGVEGFKKTLFPKGEIVEVDDEVGKALVENESGLFTGEFREPTDKELESAERNKPSSKSGEGEDVDPDGTQTASGSTSQTTTPGAPATGTATGGSAGRRASGTGTPGAGTPS